MISLGTVSNAFPKSTNAARKFCCFSPSFSIKIFGLKIASVVEKPGLNQNWSVGNSTSFLKRFSIILSYNLKTWLSFIYLYLLQSMGSFSCSKTGVIRLSLHFSGIFSSLTSFGTLVSRSTLSSSITGKLSIGISSGLQPLTFFTRASWCSSVLIFNILDTAVYNGPFKMIVASCLVQKKNFHSILPACNWSFLCL